jgi:general secretion pathway protein A
MEKFKNLIDEAGNSRVYLNFFKLKEPPFSITPDPEFLFLSQTHHSAIEKVIYSIDTRMGFILLTGEVGTGKTTICRSIIDTLNTRAEIVYIINPSLSGRALIASILDDLGIQYPAAASKKDLIDQLNHFLLYRDSNSPVVIIIDDAQTMPLEALEGLRLLSNLETDKEKMIQMVIVGQPELEDLLLRPEMRQLRQRIFVNCRLENLKSFEVDSYIDSRLFLAGSSGDIQFTREAKQEIAKKSKGIPRMINKICDYALTAGYVAEDFVITKTHVRRAINEMGDMEFKKQFSLRGAFDQTKIGVRKLLFASALSLAAVLAISVFPHSENIKSFLIEKTVPLLTDDNASMVNSSHPGDAKRLPMRAVLNQSIMKAEHFESKPEVPKTETEDVYKSFSIYFNQ